MKQNPFTFFARCFPSPFLAALLVVLLAACSQPLTLAGDSAAPGAVAPRDIRDAASPGLAVSTPTSIVSASPTQTASPLPTATQTPVPSLTRPPEITLLFTGIIVPGRCVQAGVDAAGNADYIYDGVRDLISGADLAVGTLNGTISEFSPKTGCVVTFVLTGSPQHADAIANAGFDAMSVATNHIKNCGLANCGDRAFLETLEQLRRVGVAPVGAGNNLAESLQPIVLEAGAVRFAIVSLGEIEQMAFAGENTPGIAVLNEENLRSSIRAARQVADVVIVMPHWGPEYSAIPNYNQRTYARIAVEAGANLVVGNHTHVVQAYQEIDGVPVFYGLGNFVFDQTWSPETQQSVLLSVSFRGTQLTGYEFLPVVTEMDGRVRLADPAEAELILKRMADAGKDLR